MQSLLILAYTAAVMAAILAVFAAPLAFRALTTKPAKPTPTQDINPSLAQQKWAARDFLCGNVLDKPEALSPRAEDYASTVFEKAMKDKARTAANHRAMQRDHARAC